MLGHRGCRLAITYPEICRMQARAIFEAACAVAQKTGDVPSPEIMVPLAATAREISLCKQEIDAAASAVMAETVCLYPISLARWLNCHARHLCRRTGERG